jgi:3-phenylpropionate/cinnamic acid dioxygenase small subunit
MTPLPRGDDNIAWDRIGALDPLYAAVLDFFHDEAMMLDERRFEEWAALLAEDVTYGMPVRPTLSRRNHSKFGSLRSGIYDETRFTLLERLRRAELPTSWGEEPPARTRRFVTNLRLWIGSDQTIKSRVNVMMTVFRDDEQHPDLVVGERRDRLRPHKEGFLLTERLVLLDQATLPSRSLMLPL